MRRRHEKVGGEDGPGHGLVPFTLLPYGLTKMVIRLDQRRGIPVDPCTGEDGALGLPVAFRIHFQDEGVLKPGEEAFPGRGSPVGRPARRGRS